MEKRYMVAVDLGTQMIGLAVAEETGDGKLGCVYCDSFPSAGIDSGKVQNAGKLSEALKPALENAEAEVGGKIRQVRVNAQKQDIRELDIQKSLELKDDDCISEEHVARLREMAREEGVEKCEASERVVAVIEQSYDTDDERNIRCNDIVGRVSACLEGRYKVYLCRSNSINAIERAFRNVGIEDVDVDFCPDCCGSAVLSQHEMESGCALIDFGAGACSLSIFRGGSLRHYWAVPFGGRDVTSDIKSMLGVSSVLAENIKKGYGGCMPDNLGTLGEKRLRINAEGPKKEFTAKYLSEIVTARCTEIVDALLYEIQKSGYSSRLKSGIVLCGGGARMRNLGLLISRMSGYNCRIAKVSGHLFGSGDRLAGSADAMLSALLLSSLRENVDACVEISSDTEKSSLSRGVKEEEAPEAEKNSKGGSILDRFFGTADDVKERQEKEEERIRKEAQKAQKEAEKARREAEKARRAEEKRRREAEKIRTGESVFGTLFGPDGEDA